MSRTEIALGALIVCALGALVAVNDMGGGNETATPVVAEANSPPDAGAPAPTPAAAPAPSEAQPEQKTAANEEQPSPETAAAPAPSEGQSPPKPAESTATEAPATGNAGSESAAPSGDKAATEAKPAPAGQPTQQSGEKAPEAGAPAASGGTAAAPDAGGTPLETAKSAEKGSLKSPYSDYKSVAAEGQKVFMAAGCNGCHGGTGGGGMGPPLTNIWVYGSDDDTLFRLVALGTDEFQKQGYSRKGSENVVGPMPPQGTIVKSNDDLWKIIAWVRSINPSSAGGAAPPAPQ
jgi:mono/diheme cytochrome c family protein